MYIALFHDIICILAALDLTIRQSLPVTCAGVVEVVTMRKL